MSNYREKIRFAGSLACVAVMHPIEFADRVVGRRDRARPQPEFQAEPNRFDPLAAAHELLGLPFCDGCEAVLPDVRTAILPRLQRQHHHDGGTALAEMLWMFVHHMRPDRVLETGVGRGVSSAYILDALARNDRGRLWSIDLPPLNPSWQSQTGAAVPDHLRSRWTYLRGASSRMLPRLLRELGTIDIFLHDSLHTYANMSFEFTQAWPRLAVGGIVVSDDADCNGAFARFSDAVGGQPLLVRERNKDGVVGLLRRATEGE